MHHYKLALGLDKTTLNYIVLKESGSNKLKIKPCKSAMKYKQQIHFRSHIFLQERLKEIKRNAVDKNKMNKLKKK